MDTSVRFFAPIQFTLSLPPRAVAVLVRDRIDL